MPAVLAFPNKELACPSRLERCRVQFYSLVHTVPLSHHIRDVVAQWMVNIWQINRAGHSLFNSRFALRSPLILYPWYPWIAIALALILPIFRFAHRSIGHRSIAQLLIAQSLIAQLLIAQSLIAQSLIAHRSIAHRSIAHRSIAHRSIAHRSIAHRSIAHRSIAHRSIAHRSIAHRSIAHCSIALKKPVVRSWKRALKLQPFALMYIYTYVPSQSESELCVTGIPARRGVGGGTVQTYTTFIY